MDEPSVIFRAVKTQIQKFGVEKWKKTQLNHNLSQFILEDELDPAMTLLALATGRK